MWASNSLKDSLHGALVAVQLFHLGLLILQRDRQWRVAFIILGINVGPMVKQELGKFEVSVTGSLVQRIASVIVPRICVGAASQQEPAHFYALVHDCALKRRGREFVLRDRVDVRSAIYQELCHLDVAKIQM